MGDLNTGATEQGLAAPDTQQNQTNPGQQTPDIQTQRTEQTPEERARFAEQRRQAKTREQHENERLTARMDTLARSRGFGSFVEMERFNQNELLQKGELTAETLAPMLQDAVEEALATHPSVQAAEAVVNRTVVDRDMEAFRSGELKEEGIAAVEDFLRMPNFPEFKELVDRGVSFEQAYKLVNMDSLLQKGRAAAKQRAMNQMTGKNHMTGTDQGGTDELDGVIVPADTLAEYRAFFPKWTDTQVRRHYSKVQKG